MNSKVLVCSVAALLAALGLGIVLCGEAGEPKHKIDDAIIKGFSADDIRKRRKSLNALVDRRDAIISLALKLARKSDDGKTRFGTKECGIRLLGEMRAVEAVPFLLDNIGFAPATRFGDPSEYEGLPAVESLVQIGSPAAKEIWERRLASADKKTLPLYLMVLKNVWGKEICTLLLNAKLKTKLPKGAKANFEAALKYFQPEEKKSGKKK